MHSWWISWYHHPLDSAFELHTPWWISGYTIEMDHQRSVIVAAVQAEDEEDAWRVVYAAYDHTPTHLEQRFCDELLPEDSLPWEHPGTRFELADWMRWPA